MPQASDEVSFSKGVSLNHADIKNLSKMHFLHKTIVDTKVEHIEIMLEKIWPDPTFRNELLAEITAD